MLQTIREHTQGWIAAIIIGLIIISFALWGIHSYFVNNAGAQAVAKVNGTEITQQDLSVMYERLKRQLQAQFGESNADLLQQTALIKKRALESLINTIVLKQAAQSEGFVVPNQKIDATIQNMPEFQVDGKFSLDKFQQVLSSSSMGMEEFLDLIHTSILVEQPKLGIVFSSVALENEANYLISLVKQERHIEYLVLPANFLKQPVVISRKQIEDYYYKNKSEFMTPEQVSVEYLELTANDAARLIQPAENDLKNYYNENAPVYQGKPYDAVKDMVKNDYIKQHSEEKFAEARDRLADLTYQSPDSLKPAADALKLPIKTSEVFSKDKPGKDISENKKIREIAFSNDVVSLGNNSDVIQISSDKAVVIRAKTHKPATVEPLEAVTTQIETKLKARETDQRMSKSAGEIVTQLNAGVMPAALINLKWSQPGNIGRYDKKVESAILDIAFRLPQPVKNKTSYGVTKLANGYAIVALKSVTSGSVADAKEREAFVEQVQTGDGLLEYELYKESLMQQAKIKVY